MFLLIVCSENPICMIFLNLHRRILLFVFKVKANHDKQNTSKYLG